MGVRPKRVVLVNVFDALLLRNFCGLNFDFKTIFFVAHSTISVMTIREFPDNKLLVVDGSLYGPSVSLREP